MGLNWETTMPFPEKFLHNKRDTMPEIDFDKNPQESFQEIKDLEIRYWRRLLENEKLWKEGIIKAIFKTGETLELILEYFTNQESAPYQNLSILLQKRLNEYYSR